MAKKSIVFLLAIAGALVYGVPAFASADEELEISAAEERLDVATAEMPAIQEGDHGPWVAVLREYLRKYGYFPNPALDRFPGWRPMFDEESEDPQMFDEILKQALLVFQKVHGLPADGVLNKSTRALIAQRRCGVPDNYGARPPSGEGKGFSDSDFISSGYKWDRTALTYSFVNYTPDLPSSTISLIISKALNSWGAVAPLTFTQVGTGDIAIKWIYHDGPGGTLAYAYYPVVGDVFFDESETWTTNGSGTDLESVAVHEFGHSLGLAHSDDTTAVMYAFYLGIRRNLTPDDILGIEYLYGSKGNSFRSYNYPSHYIRHKDSLGEISTIFTQLEKVDSQFKLVPGMASSVCSSFESMNYPGHYLRHQASRIKLHIYSADSLYKQDATFCIRQGNADPALSSFESYNYPGYFIRHQDYHLYIATGSSQTFREDSTFRIVQPIQ